ncbi:Translation initiation factor 3 subunit J component [Onygenales sp. PD_40]|nr:Translation initiation factor 3 subunit J component [Onygenales sp. PD_40]
MAPSKWGMLFSHVSPCQQRAREEGPATVSPNGDEEEESTPPSSPPLVAAQRRKFDDEEDSDDVVDDWEAAEDSEVEREKAVKAAAEKAKADAEAAAKKKSRTQRIEEHKAANRKRREEEGGSSDEEYEDEDDAAARARLRRTEQESDLKHAEDLIGDLDLNRRRAAPKSAVISDKNDPTKSIDLSAIPLFTPATKTQFTELTNALIPLLTAQSKKPQYSIWVQDFAKKLVKELPSSDIKKVASALTAASNEKLKEEKAQDKGGKKSKAAKTKTSLVATRESHVDTTAYHGDDLDDDDFM